jgi:hypothetical protein
VVRIKKTMYSSLLAIFVLLSIVGCSSENIEKVSIYETESYSKVKEDSLVIITDERIVNDFVEGFRSAKKSSGEVNMADPQYKVELGKEAYFLWINEEHGTIMNVKDTHIYYTLANSSVEKINQAIKVNFHKNNNK